MSNTETPAPIDVGAILAQLRAEVRARRLARGGAEPTPATLDLERSLDEIELHRVVSAHWPLKARTLAGKPVVLVNKVVRRLLRWYINPIVEQQNAYNDAVARALRLLADAYAELAQQEHAPQPAPPGSDEATLETATSSEADWETLQQAVRDQAANEPPAHFADVELEAALAPLPAQARVIAHWPLLGNTPTERAAAMSQRLVRQYLRWIINPIVEQQNNANSAIADALRHLARVDGEQRAEAARRRARNGGMSAYDR